MLKTIRLTPEDVKHFVDVASKCDFDIDICYNRYVVDAKSFLGVYGLDFTKPLSVSYDGCEFPYKSRVMPTSEPLKTLKAPYMARNTMKWGFFRLKSQ